MRISRARSAILAIVICVSAAVFAAETDRWPRRPVHLIVPVGVGSGPDVAARLYADRLGRLWNEPVIVENRAGAEGLVGVSAFIGLRDDHALLFSPAAPISVFPYTHEHLTYDAAKDLVPIAAGADTFGAIAVAASLKVSSLAELVALAREHPGKLNWASGGGAFPILFAGFVKSAGLDVVEIQYREQSLAIQDLAEGRLHIIATTLTPLLPAVQAGRVRVLNVTNKRRAPLAPEIPTANEAGYPELTFEGLTGFFGGREMSRVLRDRVAADIASAASDPVLVERLAGAGQAVRTSAPADFASAIDEQRAQIRHVLGVIKGSH